MMHFFLIISYFIKVLKIKFIFILHWIKYNFMYEIINVIDYYLILCVIYNTMLNWLN